MKNTMKLVGIIALIAVIGFSFAACSNGSTDSGGSKFEGKWINHDAIDNYGMTDVSYTFTSDSFVFVSVGQGDNSTYRGTFTFTDDVLSFTPAAGESWSAYSQLYTLEGNLLTLYQRNGFYLVSGPFTKQ